jgi:hypothetical protein
LRVAAVFTMAAGWVLVVLWAWVWWPEKAADEWPGLVPALILAGAFGLILLGHWLWRRAGTQSSS